MPISLGTNIASLQLGSTVVTKAYLGAAEIYSSSLTKQFTIDPVGDNIAGTRYGYSNTGSNDYGSLASATFDGIVVTEIFASGSSGNVVRVVLASAHPVFRNMTLDTVGMGAPIAVLTSSDGITFDGSPFADVTSDFVMAFNTVSPLLVEVVGSA